MPGERDKQQIENYDLWQQYRQESQEEIREKLVMEYLHLVKFQARRLEGLLPDFISREDLESYGIIGLMQAIDRFDSEKGIEFSTFASKRVRGAMIDHLRRLDWLPHSMRREGRKLLKARERLKSKLDREPTREELSDEASLSPERIDELNRYFDSAQWLSLDTEYEEATLYDFIASEDEGPLKRLEEDQRKQLLTEAIKKLNEQEKLVISLYYYDGMTQQEIAEVMEISPSRVSQVHQNAIQRLRGFLSRKKEVSGGR